MIAGIILAAGASTRLGEAKQLALLGGERLLERALRVAEKARLAPRIVVLGARAAEIERACALHAAQVVFNPDWKEGMGASIRTGVRALGATAAWGVVVMTCDQPAVHAAHLEALCGDPERTVASSYDGRHGVPAYFPARTFAALRALGGDWGARDLLRQAHAVALPGGGLDVDTRESLMEARRLYE